MSRPIRRYPLAVLILAVLTGTAQAATAAFPTTPPPPAAAPKLNVPTP